jgi:aminopeptidase N
VNQPGAPMVNVKSQCLGKSTVVTLTQQRYLFDRARFESESADSEDAELWKIPVCVKAELQEHGAALQKCFLLGGHEQPSTLTGCTSWLLGNANAGGYYRSSYEPHALHKLAEIDERALTPAERIMLLADVWASVRVGRESVGQYLALAETMRHDGNPAVMRQILGRVDYIGKHIVDSSDRESYQRWVHHLLEPIVKRLGTSARPGENAQERSLRAEVLGALGTAGRDPEVLAEARWVAGQALRNPDSVDPELAAALFVPAAVNGDAALYDQVLANFKNAPTPEAAELDLRTLASFSDPRLLRRTLNFALSPGVRSQDTTRLIALVMQNPAGRDLAWDFVRLHWLDIVGAGGPFGPGEILQALGSFCDAGMRTEVEDFFSADTGLATSRTLRESLESIEYCVDLRARQQNDLARWLDGQARTAGD